MKCAKMSKKSYLANRELNQSLDGAFGKATIIKGGENTGGLRRT
jgi:hypothetical protein